MTQEKLALSIAAIMVVFSVGTLATVIITHPSHPVVCTLNGQVVDCPPPAAVVVTPSRPAYCDNTGTERLPGCEKTVEEQKKAAREREAHLFDNMSRAEITEFFAVMDCKQNPQWSTAKCYNHVQNKLYEGGGR